MGFFSGNGSGLQFSERKPLDEPKVKETEESNTPEVRRICDKD